MVMDKFIPPKGRGGETVLQEADKVYGGNPELGIPRNQKFYDQLEDATLERYGREVADKVAATKDPATAAKTLAEGTDEFFTNYESQLSRVPRAGERIREIANRMAQLEADKARELKQFKDIASDPFNRTLGIDDADRLFSKALSDKRYMERLINKVGADTVVKEVFQRANPFDGLDFDPQKLFHILNQGKRGEGPSSIQLAFERSMGKEKGAEHFQQLEAIASLSERIKLGDPRFAGSRTPFGEGYLQEKIGQSAASLLTSASAAAKGVAGTTYLGSVVAGRFLNAKVRQAIEKAQYDVLFDRTKAKALYQALDTPPGVPIEEEVLRKLFGQSQSSFKGFLNKLFETDKAMQIMGTSATLGSRAAQEEKEPLTVDITTVPESKKRTLGAINGTMVKQSPDAQLIRNPTPTTGTVRG